jgi:cbb3-type cytochrome c oxidase subunit III
MEWKKFDMLNIVRQFLLIAISLLVISPFNANAVDLEKGQKAYTTGCASCHLSTAQGTGAFPQLAGQDSTYLKKQIRDFQNGTRQSAIMAPFVKDLTEPVIEDINAYIATLAPNNEAADPKLVARGTQIYHAGIEKVPACAACHGPKARGIANIPVLAGQHADYIVAQLQAFQAGTRKNDANSMMEDIASRLSDQDKRAVASYISGIQATH